MTIGLLRSPTTLEQLYTYLPALIDFAAAASELHRHGFLDDIPADLMPAKTQDGYDAALREVVDNIVVNRHPRLAEDGRVVLDHLDPSPRIVETLGSLRVAAEAGLDALPEPDRRLLHALVEHELAHLRLAERHGVPEIVAAVEAHEQAIEERLESLRAVTNDRIHHAANERADFESLTAAVTRRVSWDIPDTAVPAERRRATARPMYYESGAESDYQRRARREAEARQKAQAKQRERERQALDRAERTARERMSPDQHQHLAEARRRVEEREGRVGRELGRALENHVKNGPNKAGKGSVGRLINTANTLFRDRQNGIDLVQNLIAYTRELESTWKGFGGRYTDPNPAPARQREPDPDWMQKAQRSIAERERAMDARSREFIREQLRLSDEAARAREGREPDTGRPRDSRVREARQLGPRERGRARGD